MECTRWDEGLLLTSNELSEEGKQSFESHTEECPYCKTELSLYRKNKKAFFTEAILSEATTRDLDTKILDACSRLPRPTSVVPITFYFRKVALSVLFLAIGFGGGVYFAVNLDEAGQDVQLANQEESAAGGVAATEAKTGESISPGGEQGETVLAEATNDSAGAEDTVEPAQSSPRGNASLEGVVPVDLKDE